MSETACAPRLETFERAKYASSIERVTITAWRTIHRKATIGVQLALRREDGTFRSWTLILGTENGSYFNNVAKRKLQYLCRALDKPCPRDAIELESLLNDLVERPHTAMVDFRDGGVWWLPRYGRAS